MQVTLVLYLVVTAAVVARRASTGKLPQETQGGLPNGALFRIAVLDALQMTMMFEAATALPPALTVILLQAAIPATLVLSCRRYAKPQWIGALLVTAAALLAMLPSTLATLSPGRSPQAFAQWLCALVYLLSAVPAALSQHLKERLVAAHAQPVDPQQMNLTLAFFQLLVLLVSYPFVYHLQQMNLTLAFCQLLVVLVSYPFIYHLQQMNLTLALFQLLMLLASYPFVYHLQAPPPVSAAHAADTAHCRGGAALLLTAPFVAASVAMGLCVEQLVLRSGESRTGLRAVYRSLTVGVAAAMFALGLYGALLWPHALETSTAAAWRDAVLMGASAAVLVAGLVVYRASDEPDDALVTQHRSPAQAQGCEQPQQQTAAEA
ncbi:hypothetical protein JKP88DRAFT_301755 [Tribonema minus]|uniref:Uncharacterized protein n=1 Tax=Tribonema minus TaxID=303371 RepID=A0A835ZDN7_9STRA|nr:hypothetical protein JKP88DRAFT_301755 [Tribonema minus]